jgi:hypothetical protein
VNKRLLDRKGREGGEEMKDYTTKRYPDARDIRKSTQKVRERIVDLAWKHGGKKDKL